MKARIRFMTVFLLLSAVVSGNNIRIKEEPVVTLTAGQTEMELTFTLSWDNSWRDEFNWDAAWLFVKYKKEGTNSDWSHLNLGATHSGMPSDMSWDLGKTGSTVVGMFVYRKATGASNITDKVIKLSAPLPSGVTAADIENKQVYFAVSAIEMVLIPYNAYNLGDASSASSFQTAAGQSILIGGEEVVTASVKDGGNVTIPATYPKGYKGFYSMKYEVSQEQYVNFLNMLSYTQQKDRIGNNLDDLKRGDYIFGDPQRVNSRNGIALFVHNGAYQPAVFGNNLNTAEPFWSADDGQTIACNYLTPLDLLAYLDWSGLRPMSELEYEKICRAPGRVTAGEYAWNTAGDLKPLTGLSSLQSGTPGKESEKPSDISFNVNAGIPAFGPVRCGSFGTATSNQQQAGASFYGVMELSGNVGELCYNAVGGSGFNVSDANNSFHGNGALDANGASDVSASYWPAGSTAAAFAVRGGSFASETSRLSISDRSIMTVSAVRDSTVGFRGVRSLNTSALNGGTLTSPATACSGASVTIAGTIVSSDAPVSYLWYVKAPGGAYEMIAGATDVNLTYDQLVNETSAVVSYSFKRKAFSAIGEGWSDEKSVAVTNASIKLTLASTVIDGCGNTTPVVASPAMSGVTPTYTWSYNGSPISGVSGATYTPSMGHFGGATGDFKVTCTAMINSCSGSGELTVSVPVITQVSSTGVTDANCGSVFFYDDRDGDRKTYCTVKIGSQCWMGTNLNVGTFTQISSSDYWMFDEAGIQKWCIGCTGSNCNTSNVAQCDLTGGLYEWWEMLCGGQCNGSVTPANAESLTISNNEAGLSAYGAKMVSGSTTKVQGICPDGWHIPTDAEWGTLGSNKAGWGAKLGGARYPVGTGFYSLGSSGHWWSSTPTHDRYDAYYRYLNSEVVGTVLTRSGYYRSCGYSVRCLRN